MLFKLSLAVIFSVMGITSLNAQTDATPPLYSVDPLWPAVPAVWRLGDVADVAVDEQDNIWVLHRPGTLPPELSHMAAPPLIVFDTQGNYIKAWGGEGGRIYSLAFSRDAEQNYLFANEESRGTLIVDRQTLEPVTTINEEGIEGPGHLMAIDSLSNIYRAGLFGGVAKLAYQAD